MKNFSARFPKALDSGHLSRVLALQHLRGKISFTTSLLHALELRAHTWGLSLIATQNLADQPIGWTSGKGLTQAHARRWVNCPRKRWRRGRNQRFRGHYAYKASVHGRRPLRVRRHRLPQRLERDPQSGRLGGVPAERHRSPRGLEPGRLRRAGAKIFPQGGHPRSEEHT